MYRPRGFLSLRARLELGRRDKVLAKNTQPRLCVAAVFCAAAQSPMVWAIPLPHGWATRSGVTD